MDVIGGKMNKVWFFIANPERAKWEVFLKKGKVVKKQKMGEGVTKPLRLYLKNET